MSRAYISGLLLFLTAFCLLCTAVFSIGSYFSAKNNYVSAQVYADNAALWYDARSQALDYIKSGVNTSFEVPLDDNRIIFVEYNDENNYTMKLQYVGEWNPDGMRLVGEE